MQERIGSGAAAVRFAGEFVAGINRIQYNQGNGINALAGEYTWLDLAAALLLDVCLRPALEHWPHHA